MKLLLWYVVSRVFSSSDVANIFGGFSPFNTPKKTHCFSSTNQEPSFDFDLSCANQGVQIQDGSAAYSHTKATSDSGLSPKKKKKKKVTKEERKIYEERRLKTPDKKFGGLTEEDVKKLLLPDHLAENLDILFVCLILCPLCMFKFFLLRCAMHLDRGRIYSAKVCREGSFIR